MVINYLRLNNVKKCSVLNSLTLKINTIQRLDVLYVVVSKMILLVTITSVIIKLNGWFYQSMAKVSDTTFKKKSHGLRSEDLMFISLIQFFCFNKLLFFTLVHLTELKKHSKPMFVNREILMILSNSYKC